METRTVIEAKLYVLRLNPVRGYCEETTIVAISADYSKLCEWYNQQFAVGVYTEGAYRLTFKEDSPIKYHNPAPSIDIGCCDCWGHGVIEEWVNIESLDTLRARFNFID